MSCVTSLWSTAKSTIRSWHKTEFIPRKVREPIFGNIITVSIAEVAAYRIIIQDVRVGLLPTYVPYLAISLVAMFEALLGPLVAWLGYKTRKRMMLAWSIGLILAAFGWFVIPKPTSLEENELCNTTMTRNVIQFTGLTARTAVRLSVTVIVATCFCLARVATWGHYIAYTDDHNPERTSMHFGILTLARVIPLVFGYKMLTDVVEISVMLKILIITVSTIFNSLKIYFDVPTSVREPTILKALPPLDQRGFFTSMFRVLCNVLAMSQMLAMGLLAAAFWGLSYNEEEIIKTNFNILPSKLLVDHITEFTGYILAIVAVVYIGVKHSAPLRSQYDIDRGLKHIFIMTLLASITYIIIVVAPPCKKGHIAGFEYSDSYANSDCSLTCGCDSKWQEYSPVCVVDTMTTYVSPCHAGCTGSFTIDNLNVYTNCSCAGPSGRASPGACSDVTCRSGYSYHKSVYAVILTLTVLAFQTQGMVVVKSVDPRDKSIAMGIMWAVVATIAFVVGNNIFNAIALKSCSWYTGDKCQLYKQRYPYVIGFTCSGLAFLALTINLVARGYLKIKKRGIDSRTEENNECEA